MRSCLTEVLVVLVVVMAAAEGREDLGGLSLKAADYRRLGIFLGELTHSLYANTAALCLLRDQGANATISDYWLLAAELRRSFVYVVPCDEPLPEPRPCFAATPSSHFTCRKSLQVDIYITDSKQMGLAMAQVVERYRGSRGDVTQVVVGRQLTPPLKIEAGVMSWILASYRQEETVVDVEEIFSFREPDASLVRQPLGRWQPGGPLMLTYQPRLGPQDFHGNTVVMASFPYEPYFMIGKKCKKPSHSEPDTDQFQMRCVNQKPRHQLNEETYIGYFIDIFSALSQKLNFTYRIMIPSNKEDLIFGTGRSDNYSGIVGLVALQEADIAMASLSMSQGRLDDIDFSTNIDYYARNLYISANATESNVGWGTYAKVFTAYTWLGTAGVLLVTTCVMWVLNRGERTEVPPDILTYKDIVFMFFSCLVQQGVPTTPISLRGRTVFWLFWVSCVVLYAYYTARLTSYLAVSTASPPFTTFKGAVDMYPEWQVGIMKGTPLRTFIEDAKAPIYKLFSTRLDENPHLLVNTEEEGVKRLQSEKFAFFTDSPNMRYVFMGSCALKEIPINLFPNFGRLGYMKNLPFAGVFDMQLTRMDDGGILDRLRRRWLGNDTPCEEPSPFTELDFTHTVTAFVILLLGAVSALVLLFLEKLHVKRRARRSCASRDVSEAEVKEMQRRGKKRKWEALSGKPSVYEAFVDKQVDYSLAS